MTAIVKKFLDFEDFYELNTSYTLVDAVWLNPLEFMASHSTGLIVGLETITLQGVAYVEVDFADLDNAGSVGKYTVDPTTNSVIFIVTKGSLTTNQEAKDMLQGILIQYETVVMEYFSSDALYTLESYSSDGTLLGQTDASSMGTLVSKIYVLDANLNVNNPTGYYIHKLRRALQSA